MATTRINWCPNPRYIGTDGKQGSGSGSWTQEDVTSGAPDGGGFTKITVTSIQTGTVDIGTDAQARTSVTAGKTYTLSTHAAITHRDTLTIRAIATWLDATGAPIANTLGGDPVTASGSGWRRYPVTGVVAPAGATQVQVRLRIDVGTAPLDIGDVIRIGQRMVEEAPTLQPYFDGSYTDTEQWAYDWTAEENASASQATWLLPEITASILNATSAPQPVRIVLSNIPAGATYVVTGMTSGGRTWAVAGGTGISAGVQIILDDNRAPVNTTIHYRLVITGSDDAGAWDSNTLVVPWAPKGASGKYVIQSLDGKSVVPLRSWQDNDLPKAPILHTATFQVRGRRRPVAVFAVAGEGTMTVTWLLDRVASAQLDQIIASGGGITIRTDGTARDLPVSDNAVITAASSSLWRTVENGSMSTARVWELELTWIDDPEPSSVPVIYTVDEVDALLAGKTVDEVDAMFAGMTVDQVDAQDWGALDA